MPTVNLEATAEGTDTAFSLGAGASKTAAVNLPDDDATSYIQGGTSTERQSFVMENAPGDFGAITSMKVAFRAIEFAGNADANGYFRYAGNTTDGSTEALTGGYADYLTAALARPGGGQWDFSSINAAELGIRHVTGGGGVSRVTTLYAVLDYKQGAGGFMSLVSQFLPLMLGGSLSLRDFCHMAAEIHQRDSRYRRRILPADMPQFIREVRAYRHPKHFLLGVA